MICLILVLPHYAHIYSISERRWKMNGERERVDESRGWERVRERARKRESKTRRGRGSKEEQAILFERKSIEQLVNHLCPLCSNSQLQKLNWIYIENIPSRSSFTLLLLSLSILILFVRNQLHRNIENADSILPPLCILRFRWIIWLNQKSTTGPNEPAETGRKEAKQRRREIAEESFNICKWVVSLLFFISIRCNICHRQKKYSNQ